MNMLKRTEDGAPWKSTFDWRIAWCHPIHHNPLCLSHEPTAHPLHNMVFQLQAKYLSKRILWEAVPKALLKFKKITSTGFPVSYRWATLRWHGYRSKYKDIDDIYFPARLSFTSFFFFNFNVAICVSHFPIGVWNFPFTLGSELPEHLL